MHQAIHLKPILQGRVFSRIAQFQALPPELQSEVQVLKDHLRIIQNEVFARHHTLQLRVVRGVRYKHLLEVVDAWLQSTEACSHAVPVAVPQEPLDTTTAIPVVSPDDVAETPAVDEAATTARLTHAKRLIDALVLEGFITPYKEPKAASPTTPETFEFRDTELFVPLATSITGLVIPTTTVWDLVDGAVFASYLKRKSVGLLSFGHDVYVVVNARARSVTLFKSDVARVAILIYEAALTRVTFDKAHSEYGIRIWSETGAEVLAASSIAERDAFVGALETIGVKYQEEYPVVPRQVRLGSVTTSHTFTVDEVTAAAADAVALDDSTEIVTMPRVKERHNGSETDSVKSPSLSSEASDEIAKTDAIDAAADSPKNNETSASSPTEKTECRDTHGTALKTEKVSRFDDTDAAMTVSPATTTPTSNCSGHRTEDTTATSASVAAPY